jgi:hypothetical protein
MHRTRLLYGEEAEALPVGRPSPRPLPVKDGEGAEAAVRGRLRPLVVRAVSAATIATIIGVRDALGGAAGG